MLDIRSACVQRRMLGCTSSHAAHPAAHLLGAGQSVCMSTRLTKDTCAQFTAVFYIYLSWTDPRALQARCGALHAIEHCHVACNSQRSLRS